MRRRLRLPLIAALALAFISLALISGIAYIVVLAGATSTAEKFAGRPGRSASSTPRSASIKSRLDAVTDHLEMVAALAGSGRLDISSPVDMREALCGDDDPGAGDLERRLRHLRPQAACASSAGPTAR